MRGCNLIGERGVALIMVLWVLDVLMVMALSFSSVTHTNSFSTLAFKEGMERKFFAEAGVESAIAEILYKKSTGESAPEGGPIGPDAWRTDGRPYEEKLADGFYVVRITDESGKLNVNASDEILLKNLVLNTGVDPEAADTIVDSIMDWKDPDDLHRLNGAERDYYMSLKTPYKPRESDFETLEELLLVKGVTPDVFYGNEKLKGIVNFLTVSSAANMVDINSSPPEVIEAVPGVTPDMAESIINYREAKQIEELSEIRHIMGDSFELLTHYFGTGGSGVYTIEASGHNKTKEEFYPIKATIAIEGTGYRYLSYESPSPRRT